MSKIFTFHEVSDQNWLEEVILLLKSKYKMADVHSVYDSYANGVTNDNLCHITVDDAHVSFYQHIYPVLKKHEVPATLFASPKICSEEINFWFQEIVGYNKKDFLKIISDEIGVAVDTLSDFSIETILKAMPVHSIWTLIGRFQQTHGMLPRPFQNMTLAQLREVRESGLVEIGAHTVNHPILHNETPADMECEITESVKGLSAALNYEVKYFAYPNGIPELDFTAREKKVLPSCGVRLAFNTKANDFNVKDDPMSAPRFCISDREQLSSLKRKIFLGPIWNRLKNIKPNGEFSERRRFSLMVSNKAA
jgi:peptidoglycan/xylan/chitin deacetylase (PgdA/CDA1 family)